MSRTTLHEVKIYLRDEDVRAMRALTARLNLGQSEVLRAALRLALERDDDEVARRARA